MPLLLTSLHVDYQKDSWSILEALRELLANALDAEKANLHTGKGKCKIEYSNKTLTITTQELTVSATALLMGTSSSKSDAKLIGQFGEGLPMALLVLARGGWDVTIYNGSEKWTPKIVKSDEYGGAKVLGIETRKMIKERNDFSVEIKGIEKEELETLYSLFFALEPDLKSNNGIYSDRHGNSVITNPKFAQCVYIKGVFVTKVTNLMFGYNIQTLQLNRDRKFVDISSLSQHILTTLDNTVQNSDTFLKLYVSKLLLIGYSNALETESHYTLRYNSAIQEEVKSQWINLIPVRAIICRNNEEAESIKERNKEPFIVPSLIYDIIQAEINNISTFSKVTENEAKTIKAIMDNADYPFYSQLARIHKAALSIWPSLPSSLYIAKFEDDYQASYANEDGVYIPYTVNSIGTAFTSYINALYTHSSLGGNYNVTIMSKIILHLTQHDE